MSENGKTTYKQKLHEPILNPIQIIILLLVVVFNVITAILPLLIGIEINPVWCITILTIGIISYAALALLRAAYPEEVPDMRITTAFKVFIKQVIDALTTNKGESSDLKCLLERIIVWSIREWDVIYQMELEDAIAYAKEGLRVKEPEPNLDNTNTIIE